MRPELRDWLLWWAMCTALGAACAGWAGVFAVVGFGLFVAALAYITPARSRRSACAGPKT